MSNISSSDVWKITLMRWIARTLSIPWAFWAIFWTMFLVLQTNEEGESLPTVIIIIIVIIVALMYIGAAIIASVWGKEALGGRVLLFDGVLLFIWVTTMVEWTKEILNPPHLEFAVLAYSTVALPPLVAGFLFLVCHRKSKSQKAQNT